MEFEGRKVDFEKALNELDEMINRLEVKDIGLEESLKLYKEGMKLCLKCEEELKKAKLEIKTFDENLNE